MMKSIIVMLILHSTETLNRRKIRTCDATRNIRFDGATATCARCAYKLKQFDLLHRKGNRARKLRFLVHGQSCLDHAGQFNHCCAVHDDCYANQRGRNTCDEQFCECTKNVIFEDPAARGCYNVYADLYEQCPNQNVTLASCALNHNICRWNIISFSCVGVQQLGAASYKASKDPKRHYTKAGQHSAVSSILVVFLFWMALPGAALACQQRAQTNKATLTHEYTLVNCDANRKCASHSSDSDVLLNIHSLRIAVNKKHVFAHRQCRGRVFRDGKYGLDFDCSDHLDQIFQRHGLKKLVHEYVDVPMDKTPIVYVGRINQLDDCKLALLRFYGGKLRERMGPVRVMNNNENLKVINNEGLVAYINPSYFTEASYDACNAELKALVVCGSRARVRQALFRLNGPTLWSRENGDGVLDPNKNNNSTRLAMDSPRSPFPLILYVPRSHYNKNFLNGVLCT